MTGKSIQNCPQKTYINC